MRVALLTPLLAAGALFACSTFSDAEVEPPAPTDDAGTETGPPRSECEPVLFDPNAPSACPGVDLLTDERNCGVCGRRCEDRSCVGGVCERETLDAQIRPVTAFDGNKLYAGSGSAIVQADVAQSPLAFTVLHDNKGDPAQHIEVYGGELYVGWGNDQTIIPIGGGTARRNGGVTAVTTTKFDGHYFPGATSYYLFDDPAASGVELVRIAGEKSTGKKTRDGFLPIARSGDAIYWTEKTPSGANIYGPWDRDAEPIARVDATLEAFAAEGETVYVAGGGFLSRSTRGAAVVRLAHEPGIGVGFAIDGDQLFYVTKRPGGALFNYHLFRIDKCKGGVPVPLAEMSAPITAVYPAGPTYVIINSENGLFRIRR